MTTEMNILIVGVGGQGTLLTSKILGAVAISEGYDIKMSEVHGMAQRGGSVVTYVRFGKKVASPVIDKYSADIMLAFEELEALRWVDYLKDDGLLIMNTQKIDPMPVIMRKAEYPGNIKQLLGNFKFRLITIDALEKAKTVGNIKVVNTVMLGRLAKELGMESNVFISAIRDIVPQKFIELNTEAFKAGYM